MNKYKITFEYDINHGGENHDRDYIDIDILSNREFNLNNISEEESNNLELCFNNISDFNDTVKFISKKSKIEYNSKLYYIKNTKLKIYQGSLYNIFLLKSEESEEYYKNTLKSNSMSKIRKKTMRKTKN